MFVRDDADLVSEITEGVLGPAERITTGSAHRHRLLDGVVTSPAGPHPREAELAVEHDVARQRRRRRRRRTRLGRGRPAQVARDGDVDINGPVRARIRGSARRPPLRGSNRIEHGTPREVEDTLAHHHAPGQKGSSPRSSNCWRPRSSNPAPAPRGRRPRTDAHVLRAELPERRPGGRRGHRHGWRPRSLRRAAPRGRRRCPHRVQVRQPAPVGHPPEGRRRRTTRPPSTTRASSEITVKLSGSPRTRAPASWSPSQIATPSRARPLRGGPMEGDKIMRTKVKDITTAKVVTVGRGHDVQGRGHDPAGQPM